MRLPVAVLALSGLVFACKTPGDQSEVKADVGMPSAYVGQQVGSELKFENGIVRKISGYAPLTLESGSYGPDLTKSLAYNYGWFSNTPWKCVDAERFATDKEISPDKDQLCYIEINTTGNYGFAFSIIGLDKAGKGLTMWSSPSKVPLFVPNGGKPQPVTMGPPRQPNVIIDHDAVLKAMQELHTKFSVDNSTRNDCLANARAAGWLDIQAHYYCLLPYSPHRVCYSTELVTTKNPVGAYDKCFAKATDPEVKWVDDNQAGVFKYVMFTLQGKADFNIESENQVINDYYAAIGESPRPRRLMDTYPEWLADQPRYYDIRKAQAATQAAAAAAAAAAGGGAAASSPPAGSATPAATPPSAPSSTGGM